MKHHLCLLLQVIAWKLGLCPVCYTLMDPVYVHHCDIDLTFLMSDVF